MDINLFANLDEATGLPDQQTKTDPYNEMLEKRVRPVLPDKQAESENNLIPMEETITESHIEAPASEQIDMPNLEAFTTDQIMARATEYFKGDTLAANVWMNKYALKDSDGNIYELTPDDMHHRLAAEVARIEKKYKNPVDEATIFDLFRNFKYIIPQGSPMAGMGNNLQVSSLSNCFVIGGDSNYDSYGGIMKIDQEQVQLMKRRGGVGHDLSHIRPTGSPVKNSALTSTGIVPFMERYSNSTREVAQDGRRGALMLTISVKHPDAERFIGAKLELGKVTGANVSVKIDDEFMQSVVKGIPYRQQYPIVSDNPQKEQEIDAIELWNKIIHNAWQSAEPGVLFWDTIIRESVPDCYADLGFKTLSTNPCGEIPLCPYDSCRLLAINLFSYVDHPFTEQSRFNFDKFKKHAAYALRIMDDIIDLETEKIDAILAKVKADPEDAEVKRIEQKLWENIRQKTLQGRRTGIGITAEGDMLAALGLRYGSDEATEFSVEVHKILATEVYGASADLAAERGAFPLYSFEREKNNPFIQRLKDASPEVYEKMARHGRRNIAMLTIAPTGSVSICTQTTSGIEPVFMVTYTRRRKVNPNDKNANVNYVDGVGDSWEEYVVFHPKFVDWLVAKGFDPEKVKRYKPDQLQELVMQSPYYKATSQDIDWLNKVKMQGAIQKWVDHSISVTVNLPADATEDLVSDVYKTAWESGCKGMTIYRDGCRDGVLVTNDNKSEDANVFRETTAPSRPQKIEADIVRFQNDYEKWLAVIGLLDGKPYEVFTGKADGFYLPAWVQKGWVIRNKADNEPSRYDFQFLDKDGYKVTIEGLSRSFNKEFWNYAKLISGILRHGMPLPFLVNLIDNLNFDNDSITTWKNGVVRSLKRYIPDGTQIKSKNACPSCKEENTLVYKEGCLTCANCGYSKCS
jgi:ribonucleoside-diphosphate reductase alpha chain